MFDVVTNVIKTFSSVITIITGSIKIYEFIKDRREKMKTIFFNPIGKIFTFSLVITALLFLIPWKRIHIDSVDSGKPAQKNIELRNPVSKLHDTVYIKTGSLGKKNPVLKNKYYKNKVLFRTNPVITKSLIGDTVMKNQTTISGGSDIHTITGNGNHDIINGNVEVKEPKLLSEKDLQNIYDVTMKYYKEQPQKFISLEKCDYSNAANIFKQINDFFKEKGVKFSIGFAMMDPGAPIIQEVSINPYATNGKEINILVGKFK